MIEAIEKDDLHARLSNTSGELHTAFWGRPREEVLYRSENSDFGIYRPLELLVILQHAAEVFAERVIRMLREDGDVPITRDYDPQKVIAKTKLEEESVKSNLRNFMDSRAKLFRALFPLKDEDWDAFKINHEVHGEISLRQLLSSLIVMEEDLTNRANSILKEYDTKLGRL